MADKPLFSLKFPGLPDRYLIDGISDDVKAALLQIASKVAYIDDQGATYYQALYSALYNTTWSITNTLSHCTTSNAAESVTKGDSYTATITAATGYKLTGATVSITMGGTDITASAYNNGVITIAAVTGNLVITITAAAVEVVSISATFTQGDNTVWSDDSLDSLKQYLVVTATYEDTTVYTVPSADYTLSGSLSNASSTITVSFGGQTDTFTVAVRVVGSTNYASTSMSNLTRNATSGTNGITDGVLWMKCTQSSQISGYNVWAVDCKPTLWSTIADKTVRIRLEMNSPNWSGDLSGENRVNSIFSILKNASITSLSSSNRLVNWNLGVFAPTSADFVKYEFVQELDSSQKDMSSVTSSSTAGVVLYIQTLNTVQLKSIEVVEVLN